MSLIVAMDSKFKIDCIQTDDGNVYALNGILITESEVRIPETYNGEPIKYVGYGSYYREAERHWIDYHHFKEEIIEGGWRTFETKIEIPKEVKKIYISKKVSYITRFFFMSNREVEVIIDEENPRKELLLEVINYAKEYSKSHSEE